MAAATMLRKLKQRGQNKAIVASTRSTKQRFLRDTNKRPRGASTGEIGEVHKKKTEATGTAASSLAQAVYDQGQLEEEKPQYLAERTQTEIGDKEGDISLDHSVGEEIAVIAAKNEQLQSSVNSLKHKFSMREEETHQLLLGLGALNAVANELDTLQKEYQERSSKNAALIQESLAQISNCSEQVDTLKRCRGLTASQLQDFRQECTLGMNKLVERLSDLAENAYQEPQQFNGANENLHQVETLREEACRYRAQLIEDDSVTSFNSVSKPTQSGTAERLIVALTQLDELHADMFQLKQTLTQENQYFRRHIESLISQQMTHIRDVQDNETERIHEELDEIRSGMCGILKDVHRLKERTKYLVPSMARVGSRMSRSNPNGPPPSQPRVFERDSDDQKNERWMNIPTANPQSTGYSMTMAARQCQDGLPHYEHGFDGDCYCPGVLPSHMEARYGYASQARSARSSNSSPGHSDDENWPMDDSPATGQRSAPPVNSPHYSSRSSSLSDRLSVYGEEHVVPNAEPTSEQFERQILEQHRLFWIGEGAG
ncbi:hypothetical protein P3T76_007451 [Phytophthora citrophthora]|uniref:Uncharacterized protein n=1 Tax=Phytophthora citrophthora TaxID=4793 RepID=A0AAD9LLV9_9STRA|nr:hypothetical protein P3T76_007451 [Phytophthora citrophthora]